MVKAENDVQRAALELAVYHNCCWYTCNKVYGWKWHITLFLDCPNNPCVTKIANRLGVLNQC